MDQEYINRVETYLKGDLNEDDRKKFEADLNEDLTLRKVYQQCKLAIDVVDQQVENDLRSKFKDWKPTEESEDPKIRKFQIYKIAAGIVLLIGVYFIFFQQPTTLTSEQLAFEFYNTPATPDKTMGDNQQHWSEGIDAYSRQDYQAAIKTWQLITDKKFEVSYYLAHSYFNLKEYTSAIPIFIELSEGNSVYNYPSDWYLILAYLASGNLVLYNQQLSVLLDNQNHPYYSDALDLQDKSQSLNAR